MYVCAQLFIVMYVCAQLFISYVCMCSVIYKLCMYVLSYVCMLFIECDANEIKTFIMYLLFLIPSEYYLSQLSNFSAVSWREHDMTPFSDS